MALGGFCLLGATAMVAPQRTAIGYPRPFPIERPDLMPDQHTTPDGEHTFPSTTWRWERIKVSTSAARQAQRAAGGPSASNVPRDGRKPITIEVTYEGGRTARWKVRARGRTWHFPGVMAIHDVMGTINRTLDRGQP
jgi:hypothetical protein